MKKQWSLLACAATAVVAIALTSLVRAQEPAKAAPPADVTFYGAGGPISAGVVVPSGRATLFTSGTVPAVQNKDAKPGDRSRYGDTKTQATSILQKIEEQLKAQGLTMKDVVYLRAYLVPDPTKGNKMDFAGWSEAYGAFFSNKDNPVRPARSTVAVAGLVDSDWLIEIEAVAVFPGSAARTAQVR